MAQAKCPPMTLEIPSPNSVAPTLDICDKLSDYSFRILQNTEKIESILNGLHDKVNFEKSLVTSRKDTNVLMDGHSVFVEELEGTVKSLKSRNVDNICLVKILNKEVNLVKFENAKLKAKIRELEHKSDLGGFKKSGELLNGSGTSPFIVLPVGVEDMKRTDISIPDFPPLDCPSFDFLFKADQTISEGEKL